LLTVHLRFPTEYWRRIRHSNFIQRTFGETRRRVKVIGRLPGERSCLSLVWAVLDPASHGWRGLTMTPKGLQDLRRQLLQPPAAKEAIGQLSPLPRSITPEPAPRAGYTARAMPPLLTRS
jgi:putative transposase